MMSRVFRPSLIAGALFIAFLALPGVASATVTVTQYRITSDLSASGTAVPNGGPSSAQAAAVVNAGSYSSFAYTGVNEDLKTALTNFAPGLLGNPESVPKCPEANLQANTCPAATQIGTSRLDVRFAGSGSGTPVAGIPGIVYNAEPLTDEPGRLGVVTPVPGSPPLVSSIPFRITPRGGGDYGLTGTLTDVNELDSVPAFGGANLQVYALSFILNGATNNYVRNPTSCQTHNNTGQAAGYEDPTFTDGPAYQFGTTGCDTVPFKPTTTLELGDAGNTGFNRHAPFKLTIRQTPGEADQKGNKITLPVELNTNNPVYKLCTQAQADADNCPADSKFGGAAAKSPFLSEEVKGPVYLVQQTNTSLPGLLIDLHGRVNVKIQTKTTLVNNKAIQSLVLNCAAAADLGVPHRPQRRQERRVPEPPGPVLQRRLDVEVQRRQRPHQGLRPQRHHHQRGEAEGEGQRLRPGVSGKISSATSSRPSVRLNVDKHPDAPNFKELTVTLGDNLSLVKSRIGTRRERQWRRRGVRQQAVLQGDRAPRRGGE